MDTHEEYVDIPAGARLYDLRPDGTCDLNQYMLMVDGEDQVPVCFADIAGYEVKVLGEYYYMFKPRHQAAILKAQAKEQAAGC